MRMLLVAMIAGLALHAGEARAQETFVCTDATSSSDPTRPPLELRLKDGILREQPLGTPRYRLLADTAYAIIGEDHHGDFEPALGMVSVFVATIVIDRTTGSFTTTTSQSDRPPQHRIGRCRMFEERVVSGLTSTPTHVITGIEPVIPLRAAVPSQAGQARQ
jgi:hypothetical protein